MRKPLYKLGLVIPEEVSAAVEAAIPEVSAAVKAVIPEVSAAVEAANTSSQIQTMAELKNLKNRENSNNSTLGITIFI